MADYSPAFKLLIAGIGFSSEAYDLFIINITKRIMDEGVQTISDAEASMVSSAALVGAMIGMLTFGYLADLFGRRLIFIITLSCVIVGSFGSALSFQSAAFSIYAYLSCWRGLLGLGIGGEYAVAASVSSEASSDETRGRSISSVFAMQGVGNVLAALVGVALLHSGLGYDAMWRIALFLGGVPGLLTIYWRVQMKESASFEHSTHQVSAAGDEAPLVHGSNRDAPGSPCSHVSYDAVDTSEIAETEAEAGAEAGAAFQDPSHPINRHTNQAELRLAGAPATYAEESQPGDSKSDAPPDRWQLLWDYRWVLLGTSGSWFIFDVVFYANGLFAAGILQAAGVGGKDISHVAIGNLIVAGIALPGYIVAVLTIESIGRRVMQLQGFLAICVLFTVIGMALGQLESSLHGLFVALYGATFFFSNFGPNTTTYVLPAESFPTIIRATCHGISAASGKLGAVIGGAGLEPLLHAYGSSEEDVQKGLAVVLYVCAALALAGALWTLAFTVDHTGESLEEATRLSHPPPVVFGENSHGDSIAALGDNGRATRMRGNMDDRVGLEMGSMGKAEVQAT